MDNKKRFAFWLLFSMCFPIGYLSGMKKINMNSFSGRNRFQAVVSKVCQNINTEVERVNQDIVAFYAQNHEMLSNKEKHFINQLLETYKSLDGDSLTICWNRFKVNKNKNPYLVEAYRSLMQAQQNNVYVEIAALQAKMNILCRNVLLMFDRISQVPDIEEFSDFKDAATKWQRCVYDIAQRLEALDALEFESEGELSVFVEDVKFLANEYVKEQTV